MSVAAILLTLGLLFLLGLAADLAGRFTALPRVTLLLLCGLLVGDAGLGLLPAQFIADWFEPLTSVALAIIGFLLGQQLTPGALRRRGRAVVGMSLGKVFGAALVVLLALLLSGVDPVLALVLAGIAPATAPAATYDVVKECGARGEFTSTLLGIVALDDAWGLLLFSLLLAAAGSVMGDIPVWGALFDGVIEVAGSALVGLALGVPMAFLSGRVRAGEPSQAEAMGMVLLCSGVALHLSLSPILAAMVMGSCVASLAAHHNRPFHAIEGFEWPFMILFFVLAGASMHLDALKGMGALGLVYILGRAVGLYLGIHAAGRLSRAPARLRRWLGLALLPQAGVALGMALLASQRFPELAGTILPVVLSTTVVLEIVAPFITRRVLQHVGDARRAGR